MRLDLSHQIGRKPPVLVAPVHFVKDIHETHHEDYRWQGEEMRLRHVVQRSYWWVRFSMELESQSYRAQNVRAFRQTPRAQGGSRTATRSPRSWLAPFCPRAEMAAERGARVARHSPCATTAVRALSVGSRHGAASCRRRPAVYRSDRRGPPTRRARRGWTAFFTCGNGAARATGGEAHDPVTPSNPGCGIGFPLAGRACRVG